MNQQLSSLPVMPLPKAAALGGLVAIVLVIATFFVATAISGDLVVTPFGQDETETIGVATVVPITVIGAIVGLGLAWLARRFTGNPAGVFLGVCVVGLLIYAIAPFTASEETVTAVWLNVMHIVVAVPIVGLLFRSLSADDVAH